MRKDLVKRWRQFIKFFKNVWNEIRGLCVGWLLVGSFTVVLKILQVCFWVNVAGGVLIKALLHPSLHPRATQHSIHPTGYRGKGNQVFPLHRYIQVSFCPTFHNLHLTQLHPYYVIITSHYVITTFQSSFVWLLFRMSGRIDSGCALCCVISLMTESASMYF